MASSVLSKMKAVDWGKFILNEKAKSLSKYMAELWKVHIFREGNTRTMTFICQYTESKDFLLDTELFEIVYVRNALVAVSAVFKDLGDKSKPQYLVKIVKDALERGESGIKENKELKKAFQGKKDTIHSVNYTKQNSMTSY